MDKKRLRQKFSDETRQDVVKLVIEGGKKCSDVAATHKVPIASVYAWVRQARLQDLAGGEAGRPSFAAVQAENVRLRKELKLAQEHALFLRKTAAYFASEKK